jgi:hypothetical protein
MTTTDPGRAQAVAWLAGRLAFVRLLADLQAKPDTEGSHEVEHAAPEAARAA